MRIMSEPPSSHRQFGQWLFFLFIAMFIINVRVLCLPALETPALEG
jgi:hypothetical protein